jgi:hypothetical protein
MTRRLTLFIAVALVAAVAGATVAVGQTAGNSATLTAFAGGKVVINKYTQDTSHWIPGAVSIKSGGTLTIKPKGAPAPHTFSVVKAADVPKGEAVFDCKACEKIGKSHGFPEGEGPPKHIKVDVGAAGIDQAGDSVVLDTKKSTKLVISAKAGTTLRFICVIHPWMQGKLTVK